MMPNCPYCKYHKLEIKRWQQHAMNYWNEICELREYERQVDSERAMNAVLTDENDALRARIEDLENMIKGIGNVLDADFQGENPR